MLWIMKQYFWWLLVGALTACGGGDGSREASEPAAPVTKTTTLATRSLTIPSTGYTQQNNAELNSTVLTSPEQTLQIPSDAISFTLQLRGGDVGLDDGALFIAGMTDADGFPVDPFQRHLNTCDTGLCVTLVPRRPDIKAISGTWHYTLGSFEPTLDGIDIDTMRLDATIRTGPEPNLEDDFPATLQVKPFLTTNNVSETELSRVLDHFQQLANNNSIAIELDEIMLIDDLRFAEVAADFNDSTTAELVSMGAATRVNIFFIGGFTGPDGPSLLGVTGGIPGPLGIQNNFNGILINALATRDNDDAFYFRTTAEVAFHEMAHFLGLFHTTERQFAVHDVIDDTPTCEEAIHDENDDGIANLAECPDGLNPLFWDNDLDATKNPLTADQRQVIFYSPLARP